MNWYFQRDVLALDHIKKELLLICRYESNDYAGIADHQCLRRRARSRSRRRQVALSPLTLARQEDLEPGANHSLIRLPREQRPE
jgi:hypothetical protein